MPRLLYQFQMTGGGIETFLKAFYKNESWPNMYAGKGMMVDVQYRKARLLNGASVQF